MTADEQVRMTTRRILDRIAEEPDAKGDFFALTARGHRAVAQILNECNEPTEKSP